MEWDDEQESREVELPEHKINGRAPETGPFSTPEKQPENSGTERKTEATEPEPIKTERSLPAPELLPETNESVSSNFGAEELDRVDERSFIRVLESKLSKETLEYLQTESFASKLPIESLIEAKRLLQPQELNSTCL